jgi:hypothetical protein
MQEVSSLDKDVVNIARLFGVELTKGRVAENFREADDGIQ